MVFVEVRKGALCQGTQGHLIWPEDSGFQKRAYLIVQKSNDFKGTNEQLKFLFFILVTFS